MNTTKPCCPNCRSTELALVGCFLLSPEGVPLQDVVTPELLLRNDFAITRELMRCTACNQRVTLEMARQAANLPSDVGLWEDTRYHVKKPVICPICNNKEHFVRDVLRVYKEIELVTVEEGKAQVTGPGGDTGLLEEIRLRYLCAKEECKGVVVLHKDNYVLSEDV